MIYHWIQLDQYSFFLHLGVKAKTTLERQCVHKIGRIDYDFELINNRLYEKWHGIMFKQRSYRKQYFVEINKTMQERGRAWCSSNPANCTLLPLGRTGPPTPKGRQWRVKRVPRRIKAYGRGGFIKAYRRKWYIKAYEQGWCTKA